LASRQHAELVYEHGTLTVTDLHSRNGTFVNGKPVRTQELLVGSVLRIGRVAFDVRKEFDEWSEHGNDEDTPGAFWRNGRNGARHGIDALPPKRRQVAELICDGYSEKQVAARLNMNKPAVHFHVQAAYKDFDVHTRAEFIAYLMRSDG
jgi:DNA-binding CsgD family transcriptional regulator